MTEQQLDTFDLSEWMSSRSARLMRRLVFRRLDGVLQTAERLPISNESRLVLFSDCHRGTNNRSDAFARNADIFVNALDYYYRRDFTYVEVGDGDELWQNKSFRAIKEAHQRVFDRLQQFYREQRLHLLFGNHDTPGSIREKTWPKKESLLLKHRDTGVDILVVHGHQADIVSDRLLPISRLVVRYIARYLRAIGLIDYEVKDPLVTLDEWSEKLRDLFSPVEARLMAWAQARRQALICGHTHRPMYAPSVRFPYFNTGSCVFPGFITGLEIKNGTIQLIKWVRDASGPMRVPVGEPRPLDVLA